MQHLVIIDQLERYDDAALERILLQLPEWRRKVALAHKHLSGRRESALAYMALCQALQESYGIEQQPRFAIGEHGKPTLPDFPTIHFSLSHCAEAVGCLLSDQPCGFDIERIRTPRPALLCYTMSEEEQAVIMKSERPDEAFTALWTRKEALLKLRGTGVAADLPNVLAGERLRDVELHTTHRSNYIFTTALSTACVDGRSLPLRP